MPPVKLIKRYANRRLYDADTSKTITLDDVAGFIKEGHDVKVFDNMTGEEITARVLGQTFLKVSMERQNQEFNAFLMTVLIREATSNLSGFLLRLIQGGIGSDTLTREKLEKIIQMMVDHGELHLEEKNNYYEEILSQLKDKKDSIERKKDEGIGILREYGNKEEKKIEELSSKLDEMARIIQEMKK